LIARLKAGWRELRQGKPGRRFRDRYERRRQHSRHPGKRRWSVIVAGVLIALAGVVLLPLPGPGIPVVLLGALLVAEESRAMARGLDALEVRARALIARLPRLQRSGNR
jgi:hypothetical protein